MIKAIDSDDAMDYLRVRKQKGETKLNIKQAKVFDCMVDSGKSYCEKLGNVDMKVDPFLMQQKEIISDASSIMGDRWYDKKGIDFKFEVNSNVSSIEFPMNQNLNLKLNLQSQDGQQNALNEHVDIDESPTQLKQPF